MGHPDLQCRLSSHHVLPHLLMLLLLCLSAHHPFLQALLSSSSSSRQWAALGSLGPRLHSAQRQLHPLLAPAPVVLRLVPGRRHSSLQRHPPWCPTIPSMEAWVVGSAWAALAAGPSLSRAGAGSRSSAPEAASDSCSFSCAWSALDLPFSFPCCVQGSTNHTQVQVGTAGGAKGLSCRRRLVSF